MIKYIKLKSIRNTEVEDFKEEGIFKKDKIYIGKMIGNKSVIIYDENKNGIEYNLPDPCGFGMTRICATNNFDILNGDFFAKNKKELREAISQANIF